MKKENRTQQSTAINRQQHSILKLTNGQMVSLPGIESVRAFTLAKLIRGEAVNPIVFANHYNMTRLASYIHDLKDRIGASFITAKSMPLTQGQRRGHTGKPFHSYHLTDAGRKAFEVPEAHQWAREVLEWHRLAEGVAG